LWRLAQEKSGDSGILVTCGGLDFGPKDGENFKSLLETCAACGIKLQHLDASTLPKKRPGMKLPAGDACVYNEEAGMLRASRCVVALRRCAMNAGGVEQDKTPVVAVREGTRATNGIAEVDTPSGTFRSRAVVMACGGWAPSVLKRDFGLTIPKRRLQPYATGVSYWKLSKEWEGRFNGDTFGPVLDYNPAADVYGMGAFEHPGWFKMCLHVLVEDEFAVENMDDTDTRFRLLGDKFKQRTQELVGNWLRNHFEPGVFAEPMEICHFEPCIYTMTPTEDFVLDAVGSAPAGSGRVVLASPCSGHGFKTAPATGSAAVALALDGIDAASKEMKLASAKEFHELYGLSRLLDESPQSKM